MHNSLKTRRKSTRMRRIRGHRGQALASARKRARYEEKDRQLRAEASRRGITVNQLKTELYQPIVEMEKRRKAAAAAAIRAARHATSHSRSWW